MRRLTLEQVADALRTYDSMEVHGDFAFYFLHIKDSGEILPTLAGADENFVACIDVEGLKDDWRDEIETLDNKEFRKVCECLVEQANEYLERWSD